MQNFKTFVAAAVLAAIMFAAPGFANPVIGEAAPDFTATTANDRTIKLDELKGKIVVLEWTNNDCPFVIKHYSTGNMQALQQEAQAKGVVWLQVISSAPGKQGHVTGTKAWELNEQRNSKPDGVILDQDGSIGQAYLAKTTPHMYVIAADGTLAYMGAIDDNASPSPEAVKGARNYVRDAVNALDAGKPVEVTNTKSYGCSVKYAG